MTGKLKKFSSSGNDELESWSNLNHDLLLIIMMHLGVFDFIAFSGVCKSWRSVAFSNWNNFMVSKQPMYLCISTRLLKKDCYLEDYTRRKLNTTIPHSNGRRCVGITCGYLIFFGEKTSDFWLVNPVTRKELHFPGFPFAARTAVYNLKGILVFSPLMSGWVLVVLSRFTGICFSLTGKQDRWRYISSNVFTHDLHFFEGKLYTIDINNNISELRLNPEPTLTLLKMTKFPSFRNLEFVSSCENLYLMDALSDVFIEVDLDEMKWMNAERTIGEYAAFVSDFNCNAAIKPNTRVHPWTQYKRLNCFQKKRRDRGYTRKMWYFPHEFLIDNDSGFRLMEKGALLNVLEE